VPTSKFAELACEPSRHSTLYRCADCGQLIEQIAEERSARMIGIAKAFQFKGTGKLTLGGCALGTGRGVLPAAGAGLSAGGVSRIQLAEPEVLTDQELWLCGQAGRLLRGEIEARESLPER